MGMFFLMATAFVVAAQAETNTLTDNEISGRELAQKILQLQPLEKFTNSGVLQIRSKTKRASYPVRVIGFPTMRSWGSAYEVTATNPPNDGGLYFFTILHESDFQNHYLRQYPGQTIASDSATNVTPAANLNLTDNEISGPFAGSDFTVTDLGLEFLHWPQQKYLKQEPRVLGPSLVLESTNPNPGTNGYSRVVSWFDKESLALVEAYAYDVNGKKLKNFYPKDIKRVDGRWQVQTLVMENLQTGSKSRLEFDLKK